MSLETLTPDERTILLERGPVSELELMDWEMDGLTVPQRMSLEKKRLFLRAFARRGVVLDGLSAARVSRSLIVEWRKQEWFDVLYQAAVDEAADRIEAEAYRRAVEGYDEPVVWQGMLSTVVDGETGEEKPLTIRKYSDALMQTMLKGARPDRYRDNHHVQHEGGAGGVLIVPAAIDPESWARAAREQQAKYAGNEGDAPAPNAASSGAPAKRP
jgi:hypothetical protein